VLLLSSSVRARFWWRNRLAISSTVAIPATYRYAEDRLAEYLSEIAIARFKGVRVDP
jgi:hypothetical protein